jgi:hypothetical protein
MLFTFIGDLQMFLIIRHILLGYHAMEHQWNILLHAYVTHYTIQHLLGLRQDALPSRRKYWPFRNGRPPEAGKRREKAR